MPTPTRRRRASRARAAALAVAALAAGATACTKDELGPAEARRERVEQRLRRTFSARQADCILRRVDTGVLVALDSGKDLDPGTAAMFTYSNAVAICVNDPDAPLGSTTTTTATPSTGSGETSSSTSTTTGG